MDSFIVKPSNRCPEEEANFFSKLCFWWMKKLLVTAARKDLEMEDMYLPMKSDESKLLTDRLERAWNKEIAKVKNLKYPTNSKNKKPSFARTIFVVFWWDYFKTGIGILTVSSGLYTVQPLLQRGIIAHFNNGDSTRNTSRDVSLYYAVGLVLTIVAAISFYHHTYIGCQKVAMRVRVSCSALIYRKILRLSQSSLNRTNLGQIVNLLSNDVGRFDVLTVLLNHLWIAPIQIFVIGIAMYTVIGPIALTGLSCFLMLLVPVQLIINRYSKRFRRKIAVLTDKRIQLMAELINGIKVVKMYAWEKPFANMITSWRHEEMKSIRRTTYLRSWTLSVKMFADNLNLFVTLLTYVLSGNVLTAEITFTIAMYFNILRAGSAVFFPQAVMQAGEAAVSIRRLQEFLLLDEVGTRQVEYKSSVALKDHENPIYESDDSTILACSIEIPQIKETDEDDHDDDEAETQTETTFKIIEENRIFIEMKRISANWIIDKLPSTLCDISMKIYDGELCALVGQVGSGKSSILNVLIKELPIGAGNLYLRRRDDEDIEDISQQCGYVTDKPDPTISYASQDPWLFKGTVRDNILFGQAWDATRYHEVTRVCDLMRDIERWPEGDMTVVGEDGIGLSGEQKARVNLARAVYKRADIYLLDDPLSAVDVRVGRYLYKKCINGYLKGKTRILVTHQLQYVKSADTIVVLDRGLVRAQGTFDELSKSGNEFITLMNELTKTEETNEKKSSDGTNDERKPKTKESVLKELDSTRRLDSRLSEDSLTMSTDCPNGSNVSSSKNSQVSEVIWKGKMSWSIWKRYYRSTGGFFTLIFLFLIFVTGQVVLTSTDNWICYWINLEAIRTKNLKSDIVFTERVYRSYANNTFFAYFSMLDVDGLLTREWAINIYAFLVACCVVFNIGRTLMFMIVCMRASDSLHSSMFRSILHASMRFFSTNASGRILNRFSKDVGTMDELLPRSMLEAARLMLVMIGVFVTITVINPWMIFPMIILVAIFYWTTSYYLRTAQRIHRLEGICKSPVFLQVNATLQGLSTIRSNGESVSQMLSNQFDSYQDVHSGVSYMNIVASATLGFFLDLFTTLFIACVCFSFILFEDGETFGATVGLAISQAVTLTGALQYGIKQATESCTYMTAVERILQYVDIKSEGSSASQNLPAAEWPTKGRLSMKNVHLSYNDDVPPVLKDLNLTIEPGWKVGVVGRTGAGKSSLISAIFRLDNEGLNGEIKIDGTDTSTLELQHLRSRISIIPQESVLFSGTLRYNIDPLVSYTDDEMWDALREVELDYLSLDHAVFEGGANFSVGQRQLVCLTRAILKKNRILILDEATANIDARTAALIQKTIRANFAKHTVITVAHRLITIIESDRIIVMDDGQVKEFGCPYELLCDHPNGPFAEMVRQTGSTAAENLTQLAKFSCLGVPPQHSLDLASSSNSEDDGPSDNHQ